MTTTAKSTYWSLTINNPNDSDEEDIQRARQKGWKVEGQKEQGENGTTHYQLMLHTPSQPRWSAVHKAFRRAHIEIARKPLALQQYVHKEETRIGQLVEQSELYPSLSKLWDLILNYYHTGLNKDGFICTDDTTITTPVEFYNSHTHSILVREPLKLFDQAIKHLISQGYHVESMAVNPSTRSCWKNYAQEILTRAAKKYNTKDADPNHETQTIPSQTDEEDNETILSDLSNDQ